MGYRPIRARTAPTQSQTSTMAPKGVNKHDAPQFLKLDQAQVIDNYLITSIGRLRMRKGLERVLSIASGPGTLLQQFVNNQIFIFAYDDKVAAYDQNTDAVTTIHTFSEQSAYEGKRYGDYFFITNKLEKIGRISRTLTYGSQSGNFTAGTVITGGTSGATAIILQDADSGTTGTLTLGSVVGTFSNGEIITDTGSGSATTTSVLTWTYTTITDAPICQNLTIANNRLIAVSPSDNPSGVAYSAIDDGSNPPFGTWTPGTDADDPDVVYSRNIGMALSAETIGSNIVVFGETGKFAFTIDTITVGSDLKKVNNFAIDRRDFGGCRAATLTARGLLYANETGFWQLSSLGQPNIPFSDQEQNITLDSLGDDYFSDVDLSNADIVYDGQSNTAFLSCAKNSAVNNLIIAYNFDKKAVTTISGWNIARWMNVNDDEIYGISALTTRVYKCFTGYDDDGNDISTTWIQETPGGLTGQNIFEGCYASGFLSQGAPLTICFSIYNLSGDFEEDKRCLTWSANAAIKVPNGWGQQSWGSSFGGGSEAGPEGTVESFAGERWPIRNFQRLITKVTYSGKQPHELTWIQTQIRNKGMIRRRNMVLNS